MSKSNIIEDTMGVIMRIPTNAVKLKLKCKVIEKDGREYRAKAVFNKKDISDMRADFLFCVPEGDDYDAVYELTDKGIEMLNELELDDDY